jgi:hypothetical protein
MPRRRCQRLAPLTHITAQAVFEQAREMFTRAPKAQGVRQQRAPGHVLASSATDVFDAW